MMNPMQAQSQFSDEDLRKLAILLQQMPADEGLASINQQEAQLLKDYGGSGTAIPGTQGLGPVGGPVRSFQPPGGGETSLGSGAAGGGGTGGGPPGGGDPGMTSDDTSGGPAGGATISGDTRGADPDPTTTTTTGDTTGGGDDPRKYNRGVSTDPVYSASLHDENSIRFEKDPATIQAYNREHGTSETGDSGGTTTTTTKPIIYKDKNGGEHHSQELANKANDAIDATNTAIEGLVLTTDTTFTSWMLANKDTYPIPPSTEAQLEGAFNNAKIKAVDAAAIALPKMVDSMNVYLRDNGAEVPFDKWWATITDKPVNLSETTMRTMYAKAVFKAERKEAFTLTQEEVAVWTRPAAQMATANNFEEWWAGNGGEGGLYPTREEAEAVHKASIIGDIGKVTIGTPTAAVAPTVTTTTVGAVSDVAQTTIDAISTVTDEDMDAIFAGGIDAAEDLLLARVEGTAVSPAEEQLKRSVENNLRMLLGATVGADADPAKVRQLKNIWADMTQEVTGKAAELRSQESMAAEKELIALYTNKSTMKLNQRLANIEVERQTAFKNGDLELAGKLANQATRLTHVITQANITSTAALADAEMELRKNLANLETMKEIAIQQGKLDLAVSLTNLQKNIALATVNIRLAAEQRSLDQSLAIIAFKGEMALMGLEVQIDTVELQAGLTEMGFELSQSLAELSSATQIQIAQIEADWRKAQAKGQETASYIAAMGTLLTGLAVGWTKTGSDINLKKNISPGSGEVESFLDALNSYKYEYKDENAPGSDAGMFVGVMAQDLEKSPMGASFVKDTPDGKMVDYGHGLAAILASQANIHDRLKQLEEV